MAGRPTRHAVSLLKLSVFSVTNAASGGREAMGKKQECGMRE